MLLTYNFSSGSPESLKLESYEDIPVLVTGIFIPCHCHPAVYSMVTLVESVYVLNTELSPCFHVVIYSLNIYCSHLYVVLNSECLN